MNVAGEEEESELLVCGARTDEEVLVAEWMRIIWRSF